MAWTERRAGLGQVIARGLLFWLGRNDPFVSQPSAGGSLRPSQNMGRSWISFWLGSSGLLVEVGGASGRSIPA